MKLLKKHPFMPLFTVMLFDHISVNITFPVLTLLFFDIRSSLFSPETSHATRSLMYGLCISIPHLMNIISIPILSTLSDEWGRKKILFICALGALAFSLTAAAGILIGAVLIVILGRFINGIFSRTNPIAQAVIGDLSDSKNKVVQMGYLQFILATGAFIGPLIGGYFAHSFFFKQLNFSLPYFIAAGFASIGALLTLFYFQETKVLSKSNSSKELLRGLINLFKNKKIIAISLVLLLFQFAWSMYYQFVAPLIKNQFSFSAHSIGIFVSLIALWLAIPTLLGIRILNRWLSLKGMLATSAYLSLIGFVLTIIASVWKIKMLIWIGAMPIAMGDVIAYSAITTLYSNAVKMNDQGKVMGICLIIVSIIWSITALLGGGLSAISPNLPMIFAPIGIILALFFIPRFN